MSKSIAGIIGTVALASTAISTTIVLSDIPGSSDNLPNRNDAKRGWQGKTITLSVSSDIKSKYSDIECLKDQYGTGNAWNGESKVSVVSKLDLDGNLKGCLLVEYYKQKNTEGKWKGGLRLVWSLSNNKEGLVTSFNSHTHEGKLISDSSAYVLVKDDNKWSFKYKEEKEGTEYVGLSDYFPQPGNEMESSDYWEFNPEIDKICRANECNEESFNQNPTPTTIRWNWQKNDVSGKTITDWSKNFKDWFDSQFFGLIHVAKQLETLKGTWTKHG